MNIYGDDTSWVRQFQIDGRRGFSLRKFWPIQVFTNGDALLLRFRSGVVLFYNSATNTFSYRNGQLQSRFNRAKQGAKGLICLPYTPCSTTIRSLASTNCQKDRRYFLVGHVSWVYIMKVANWQVFYDNASFFNMFLALMWFKKDVDAADLVWE